MSIDFDSAALQTQQEEEEEYDQEDYAREQELHKLLTDLPDDMLEDSHDGSSPEPDYSTCSHHGDANRSQPAWNGDSEWADQQRPGGSYEEQYEQGSYQEPYDRGSPPLNGHADPPHGWDPQHHPAYQYNQGYAYPGTGTEGSADGADGYGQDGYPHGAPHHEDDHPGVGGQGDEREYGDHHANGVDRFQNFDSGGGRGKASYQPFQPTNQQQMFGPTVAHGDGPYDQLQRDFLNSAHSTAAAQQQAQLQVLNRAYLRQIEELEQKLEDSRRNGRYLEHQFAITKDEREGLVVSLKESGHLLEEAKEREVHLQGEVKSLQQQVQSLTESEEELLRQQRVAEAAVDSLQTQMLEVCSTETLSRVREQHHRDITTLTEQHQASILTLQRTLDTHTHALQEQTEAAQRLREQVRQLERQREEEQVERAGVINTLSLRLEQSQQQCAKLLHTGSVQEMSQLQMKLQQTQTARKISEDMNKALQEELGELKEQITLYESAVKHGAITMETNGDWEQQLSDSYVELGIKKANWRNSRLHSSPVISVAVESQDEAVRELRSELQRCLACLKTKRAKISTLQEDLHSSQDRASELQDQLDLAQKTVRDGKVRESSLEKHLEASSVTSAPQRELEKMQEERQQLQERVEALEKRNKELMQSEEKVKAANLELCTKMREMIQELDQEKQEAAERYERTQQQYRDDVVQRVREEMIQQHTEELELIQTQHQRHTQELQSKLQELSAETLAVQECYLSVCKEKDRLEESLRSQVEEEREKRESEVRRREESEEVLEEARQRWQEQQQQAEQAWQRRLEEAVEESRRCVRPQTQEEVCQTEQLEEPRGRGVSEEEVCARLHQQRAALLQEAEGARTRAVEEAVRRAHTQLQQRHLEEITQQVEDAVSRARVRWLQELPALPEFRSSLQAEREQWEELQQQHVQEQVSSALKAAEERWKKRVQERWAGQEEILRRCKELQGEVPLLKSQQESSREEHTTPLKAELSVARASLEGEKQEEILRLLSQNQKEQLAMRERHQAQLKEVEEEARRHGQADLQEALRAKEEHWRAEQERLRQRERHQAQEEVLQEVRELLEDLRREGAEKHGSREGQGTSPPSSSSRSRGVEGGAAGGRLKERWREALAKLVGQAKQEWRRASEVKLRRVVREAQERHEKELQQLREAPAQGVESGPACSSKACTETVTKLQKKNQELQRHLEKACRQLQQTVRNHKSALQRQGAEHEEVLRKEKENHLRSMEEMKQAASMDREAAGQQRLQAGLEEMKQQYMRAVDKIRGDMLLYLQESKDRAAELIRVEVQRERQDTARRMRRYYLTCLQELLENSTQPTGAEKKIINAASKLAAMAKVLETPVGKKRLPRSRPPQGALAGKECGSDEHRAQGHAATPGRGGRPPAEAQEGWDSAGMSPRRLPLSENQPPPRAAVTDGTKPAGVGPNADPPRPGRLKVSKAKAEPASGPPQSHNPALTRGGSGLSSSAARQRVTGETGAANVTLRRRGRDASQSRPDGKPAERPTTPWSAAAFLIEELPVRDDGSDSQSDRSSSSVGSGFSLPGRPLPSLPAETLDPVKPFLRSSRSLDGPEDFASILSADGSDVTVYKEIVKGPVVGSSGGRGPTPGSEGQKVTRLCPKSLFSELRVGQGDSGFDSPHARPHK